MADLSLWWAPLDVSASASRVLAACLSSEERCRAERFHHPLDGRQFVAARAWLRRVLSSELLCAPEDVRIVTEDGGKPRVADSDLRFSTARSAGIALYATSWSMEVGVDIEAIRMTADIEAMATRFFSPAEQRALASVPASQRVAAFFQCWTHKEAYVKALGTGLRFPLRTVDVWLAGDRPAVVSGWTVHPVDMAPAFAAAVAGPGLGEWAGNVAVKPALELGMISQHQGKLHIAQVSS